SEGRLRLGADLVLANAVLPGGQRSRPPYRATPGTSSETATTPHPLSSDGLCCGEARWISSPSAGCTSLDPLAETFRTPVHQRRFRLASVTLHSVPPRFHTGLVGSQEPSRMCVPTGSAKTTGAVVSSVPPAAETESATGDDAVVSSTTVAPPPQPPTSGKAS